MDSAAEPTGLVDLNTVEAARALVDESIREAIRADVGHFYARALHRSMRPVFREAIAEQLGGDLYRFVEALALDEASNSVRTIRELVDVALALGIGGDDQSPEVRC